MAALSTSCALARRRLEPYPQLAQPGRPRHVLDVDVGLAAHELTELRVAVVARIERRMALDQVGPHFAEIRPAVVLGRAADRRREDPLEVGQRRCWRLVI